jgi:hypothetical protein
VWLTKARYRFDNAPSPSRCTPDERAKPARHWRISDPALGFATLRGVSLQGDDPLGAWHVRLAGASANSNARDWRSRSPNPVHVYLHRTATYRQIVSMCSARLGAGLSFSSTGGGVIGRSGLNERRPLRVLRARGFTSLATARTPSSALLTFTGSRSSEVCSSMATQASGRRTLMHERSLAKQGSRKRTGFGKTDFATSADFALAVFDAYAGFGRVTFEGPSVFRDCRFEAGAGFGGARFGSGGEFTRTQFHGDAGFRGAHFDGTADFLEAKFSRYSNLRRSGVPGQGELLCSGIP